MKHNFLIIDDEAVIRKGMQQALEGLGLFNIYTAGNGAEGLKIVEQNNIEAVFLDIEMPEMNGVDFMKTLSANERHPLAVVISGYDEFNYVREALRYGALDYLLKPVDSSDIRALGERIYDMLENSSEATSETETSASAEPVKAQKLTAEMIRDYIDNHYRNHELGVSLLSKEFDYSSNYIGYVFKTGMGISINDYLNQKRIELAKKFIREGQMMMKDISSAVGYSDQHYFSKMFKKYTDVSPTEF